MCRTVAGVSLLISYSPQVVLVKAAYEFVEMRNSYS